MIQAKYTLDALILEGDGDDDEITTAGLCRLADKSIAHVLNEILDLVKHLIIQRLNSLFQTEHFAFAYCDATEDEWDGVRIRYALECPDGLALSGGMELVVNAANLAITKVFSSPNAVVCGMAQDHLQGSSGLSLKIKDFRIEDNNKTPDEPTQAAAIKAYKEKLQAEQDAPASNVIKTFAAEQMYQTLTQVPPPDGLLPDVTRP